ncbi:MAG: ATP-binding protein [Planctomycetes bacterium]|nr:ATP-binding protein [Planctomycetota bacterium]
MFLRSAHLKNIRSLRDVSLPFVRNGDAARRWTLVLGENGSGKSTILRAIALALAGSEALPELLGDVDGWIANGEKKASIELGIATAEGEPRSIRLVLERGLGRTAVVKRNHANLDALDRALSYTQRSYLVAGYGVSRRLRSGTSPSPQEAPGSPRTRAVASLFHAEAELQSLETWAMDLEYRRGEKGLALVRDAVGGILPGIEFAKVDREKRQLLFSTRDGMVPLARLSDGYQHVAAWMGDLLFRITETFDDYKNPLAARGLLLIDELELHLHPLAQRRLRAFLDLKLPNLQIVATTHSALTAQQAGEGDLFYLRRDGRREEPVLHAFRGDPQKLFAHQLLLSDAFGVTTLHSPAVQEQRDRYLALRDKARRSPAEVREFAALTDALRALPDWSAGASTARVPVDVAQPAPRAATRKARTAKTEKRRRT